MGEGPIRRCRVSIDTVAHPEGEVAKVGLQEGGRPQQEDLARVREAGVWVMYCGRAV